MAYEIFARKYRPETFGEVVGQQAVARTLQNAVASARVAPVYIFSGSHGVGKTSMARIMAKALNCPEVKEGVPCAKCETCRSIAAGNAIDVNEIDAASNRGVEEARRLRQGVAFRPASLPWKVYILDEFHQLSRDAFDALLKTFEEAPEQVCFILATTELHKVPGTIRSRSQVFNFRRATLVEVKERLRQIADSEGLKVGDDALEMIARRSRGSLRDSQKLFDQVVALAVGVDHIDAKAVSELLGFASSERVLGALECVRSGDAKGLLEIVRSVYEEGNDPHVYCSDLLEGFRGLLYLQVCGVDSPVLDDLSFDLRGATDIAESLSRDAVLFSMQVLTESLQRMRRAREERVVLELALVRLTEVALLQPLGSVIARLERIEKALGGGAALPPMAITTTASRRSGGASEAAPQGVKPSGERAGGRHRESESAASAGSGEDDAEVASEPRERAQAPPLPESERPVPREPAPESEPEPADFRVAPVASSGPALKAALSRALHSIVEETEVPGLRRALEGCSIGLVEARDGFRYVTLVCENASNFTRQNLERAANEGQLCDRFEALSGHRVQLKIDAREAVGGPKRESESDEPPIVGYARRILGARLIHRDGG